MKDFFGKELAEHISTIARMDAIKDDINAACGLLSEALKDGKKLLCLYRSLIRSHRFLTSRQVRVS